MTVVIEALPEPAIMILIHRLCKVFLGLKFSRMKLIGLNAKREVIGWFCLHGRFFR